MTRTRAFPMYLEPRSVASSAMSVLFRKDGRDDVTQAFRKDHINKFASTTQP